MASKITYKRLYEREKKYRLIRRLFTLFLLVILVLFVLHVDSRLREYESVQPFRVIEQLISSLQSEDAEALSLLEAKCTFPPASEDSGMDFLLKQIKNGKLSYHELIRPEQDLLFYEITSSGERILEVTLKKASPQKGETYEKWEISSLKCIMRSDFLALDFLSAVKCGDFTPILSNVPSSLYPNETQAQFAEYLESTLPGKTLSLSASESNTEKRADYHLTLQNEPFITLTYEADEHDKWFLRKCEPHFLSFETYTVIADMNTRVLVNGKPIDEKICPPEAEMSVHAAHLPAELKNPTDLTLNRYSLSYAFSEPEIALTGENGEKRELERTQNTYREKPSAVLGEFSHLSDSIRSAANAIARFTVGKEKIDTVIRYVEFGSDAYQYLYEYDLWKSVNAGSASMNDFEITGMTKLADDCFAADVRAEFKASYTETNVIEYPLLYTFYYREVKGKWLIYDFVSR